MSLKDKPLKKCHTDKRKMIDELHNDLVQEMDTDILNEYYLDNGLLLNQYYSSDKKIATKTKNIGILSYFDNKEDNNDDNTNNSFLQL